MCASEHAHDKVPSSWLQAIKRRDWQKLAKVFASASLQARALVTTTTAVDVIHGGVKVNALPEQVTAVVNHRIAFGHSVADVQKHLTKVIAPIAKRFNLNYLPFEEPKGKLGERYLLLKVQGLPLEPAPRSATSGPLWEMLAGSVRHALKDEMHGGKPYIVSPAATTGNTDTKVYWNLSRNIFRYLGGAVRDFEANIHTVNEKTSIDNHMSVIGWIHTIVQNAVRAFIV